MQQGVSVVKASAGSGKTYRLTHDYIDLLLAGDAQAYKHILAVTFTNKATDEMKSRVIDALYQLSRSDDRRAPLAADRLKRMLHDYSCFSVSTIDKFFQTVMRSFAREIGQYASYRVELDTDAVLAQVVDLLIASIEDPAHDSLLNWLKDYSFDRVEQGDGWNIAPSLKQMAKQFLDESFLLQLRQAGSGTDVLGDKASLKAFLKKLDGIIAAYEQEAVAIGQEGLRLLAAHGCMGDDYFRKKPGRSTTVFQKWAAGQTDAGITYVSEVDTAIERFPEPAALATMFDRIRAHLGEPLKLRNTARLVRKNLYLLGIYSDLQRILDDYLRENNVVLLQLSTDLLSRIIADDDTPFVYEKIGNRYEHLMLDEAQDTSLMQWHNFRPLFRESQASGGCNLVVGDIKQSIYRWRGSDWRLMRDYLFRDLSSGKLRSETLVENWRSGKALIDFNNDVFSRIGSVLSADPDRERIAAEVQQIYDDCIQQQPAAHRNDPPGFVRLAFLPKTAGETSWQEAALQRMIADIGALLAEGYAYKDITILVRKNKEGAAAAAALLEAGISVLTEDSLQIGSAPCIAQLLSLLGWLVDPDDPVNELQSRELRDNLPELQAGSLYETCEQLLGCGILSHSEQDLPFIHAFLDAVLAFQEKYGSSLRAFMNWWEEAGYKNSICAPDGQNAVRVMTIHKAKGLSLDAVIIPFCTEPYTRPNRLQPTLWCRCPAALDGPALIPIKASLSLKNSYFEEDYEAERTLTHIDVINNWYVAFTRARSRLLIYVPLPNPPAKGKTLAPSGIDHTLYLLLRDRLDTDGVFSDGVREPFVRQEDDASLTDDPQPAFTASSHRDTRLRLSLHGDDYFSQEKSARQQGIEQHGEMARVEVDPELELRSGGRHWFDGSFRVLNEAAIVTADGEIYRPDRVLISPTGDRVVVIDYKFGAPHSAHHRQVRNYVSLMREMGYPAVEGWLWYVTTGEIVPA